VDEAAALLRLIRAYSPTGRESQGVRVFGEIARQLGYDFRTDSVGNGIASRGHSAPSMMYLGHIDTVDGKIPIRSTGRFITGRGACDAKAGLIAALFSGAMTDTSAKLQVIASVGEEQDSRGAQFVIPRYHPDYLIVGEPTRWDGITIAYKGQLRLLVTFQGRRSHLSGPTPTVVDQAVEWVNRVQQLCDTHQGPTPFESVTMKVVEIATRRQGGKESVSVEVDLRLPPRVPAGSILREITASLVAESRWKIISQVDAVEVDRRNPVVRVLASAIRQRGGTPTLYRKAGTSDLNSVLPAWNCAAAVYAPGDSHLDHTDRERTEIADLCRATETLATTWTSLASR
jgi:[amino group carrier protein]-lysine/ornithine hydrolase